MTIRLLKLGYCAKITYHLRGDRRMRQDHIRCIFENFRFVLFLWWAAEVEITLSSHCMSGLIHSWDGNFTVTDFNRWIRFTLDSEYLNHFFFTSILILTGTWPWIYVFGSGVHTLELLNFLELSIFNFDCWNCGSFIWHRKRIIIIFLVSLLMLAKLSLLLETLSTISTLEWLLSWMYT